MKQSSFRYLGVFDLLLVGIFVAVFGVRALTGNVVVPAMALAGVAALLAGSVKSVSLGPLALSWRHFVALTYALFAVMLPGSYLSSVLAGTASGEEVALLVVTSVGAFSLLFFGYDVLRGGKHFDVDANVETVVGR
jgi:hypothetical protein